MDDQTQPVGEDEFVYRRIHRSFFEPGLHTKFQPVAFRPNERDESGLSVFRARFARPVDTLVNVSPERRNDYCVAALAVRDLLGLGRTVIPEPDPEGPPGHAVIPELSWAAYGRARQRLKEVQVKLARLVGDHIVLTPESDAPGA